MSRVKIFAVGIIAIFGGVFAFAGESDGKKGFYGAYICRSCKLKSPGPDPSTVAYIRKVDQYLQKGSNYKQVSGDAFLVCNSSACVIYTRSDDVNTYFGGLRNPERGDTGSRDRAPSGGGSHGGGGSPGGGSHGGGTGTVIVGTIDTEVQ